MKLPVAPGASAASIARKVGNASTRSSLTTPPEGRPQARVSGLRALGAQLKSRPSNSVGRGVSVELNRCPSSRCQRRPAGLQRLSSGRQQGRLTMEAVAISSSSIAIDTLPDTA